MYSLSLDARLFTSRRYIFQKGISVGLVDDSSFTRVERGNRVSRREIRTVERGIMVPMHQDFPIIFEFDNMLLIPEQNVVR